MANVMEYLDFEIHIAPGRNQEYPVSVVKSPAGEATATLKFPLDDLTLAGQLRGVEAAVRESSFPVRGVSMESPTKTSVVDFGKLLFDALFVDQIAAKYRMSQDRARLEKKGLRIRLRIEAPDLSALPWEFLWDVTTGDYIALSKDTPVVRYLHTDRPPETLTVQSPICILAMMASPNDRPKLDVKRERERMDAATAGLKEAGLLKLDWLEGATWRELQRALRKNDYHIFHFVGHGGFDTEAGEGVLALCTEDGGTHLLNATEVGRMLADERTLRLVVLNACLGARGNSTDVFSSTSATLVRRGVPAVVAMQYEISDNAAIEFSRSLYEAIADGSPVDGAVAEARKAVSMSTRHSVEWGTPVLHMRSPNGELFKIEGLTTSVARASGVYGKMPSRAELVAQGAAPGGPAGPVQATASAPPPIVAAPAAPAAGSGSRWKKAGLGLLIAGVVGAAAFVLWPKPNYWAVGFILEEPSDSSRAWRREGEGCTWIEYRYAFDDTTDVYTQKPSEGDEVVLFNFTNNEHLFLPRGGGFVSVDSGNGAGQTPMGFRVVTAWAEAPAAPPECER